MQRWDEDVGDGGKEGAGRWEWLAFADGGGDGQWVWRADGDAPPELLDDAVGLPAPERVDTRRRRLLALRPVPAWDMPEEGEDPGVGRVGAPLGLPDTLVRPTYKYRRYEAAAPQAAMEMHLRQLRAAQAAAARLVPPLPPPGVPLPPDREAVAMAPNGLPLPASLARALAPVAPPGVPLPLDVD